MLLRVLFSLALISLGGAVIYHFWSVSTVIEIQNVPILIMVLCLCYVLVQIVKRYFLKNDNWWDWLYYIGLISVMIPPYMIEEDNASTFMMLAKYGTFFLIIPAVADGIQIFQKK